MADKKISQLSVEGSPATNDYVPMVDVSAGTTDRVLLSSLITLFFNNITAGSVTTAALANAAVTSSKIDFTTLKFKGSNVTSNFVSSSTTNVQVTGATLTFTVPSGGATYKFSFNAGSAFMSSTGGNITVGLWDGTVGSGTRIVERLWYINAGEGHGMNLIGFATLTAGSHTINASLRMSANQTTIEMNSNGPGFVTAEQWGL
jgi:hypothetical protein